jgi:ubiquinone/menaquinone biosynthesis C-methylase UbiE
MLKRLRGLWIWLVRSGFKLLYNELAWAYDAISWLVSLGQWRNWQFSSMRFLPSPHEGPILELGYGTAHLQFGLHHSGYNAVGLDPSYNMGQIAKRRLADLRYCLVRGSAIELPFPDRSFVAVISTFPTDYIIQPDTINEIYRVLYNQGKLIIVLSAMFSVTNPVTQFIEWLYTLTGQRANAEYDPLKYFEHSGLTPQLNVVKVGSAQVWVIEAVRID